MLMVEVDRHACSRSIYSGKKQQGCQDTQGQLITRVAGPASITECLLVLDPRGNFVMPHLRLNLWSLGVSLGGGGTAMVRPHPMTVLPSCVGLINHVLL